MGRSEEFSVIRTVALAMPLLVTATAVIVFTDLYGAAPSGDLSIFQQSLFLPAVPSSVVMGLFVPALLLAAAVPALRRRWRVTRGELVVVYCMLFLAVPILGPGFWHRFGGIQLEYPRQLNLSKSMTISPNLWPNGGNLLAGASIEDAAADGPAWTIDHPKRATTITDMPGGGGACLKIEHTSARDATRITLVLDRSRAERFVVPARRYAISARLRLDDPGTQSLASLMAGSAPQRLLPVGVRDVASATRASLLAPDRFVVSGAMDFEIPRDLGDRFYLVLSFSGSGTFYVRDVAIVETEEVYRYFEGYEQAAPEIYAGMSEAERAVVMRTSPGWSHTLLGRVPWRSWARPLMVWGLLVGGVFLAMFCLVTLFYRQWEDRDRLAFPLQSFVLDLTAGDEKGRLAILRSTPFWIGFTACVCHLFLQQMNTYYPQVPAIRFTLSVADLLPDGPLKDVVSSGKVLTIDFRPAFVAVAFMMSLEMSFSLVVFFFVGLAYRLVAAFTPLRTFQPGMQRYTTDGFPFDSLLTTGGLMFMACACVFSARKHLKDALRLSVFGSRGADDPTDATRYRRSIMGLFLAGMMLLGFAAAADLNPIFVIVYLSVFLVLALSAARIRAETGLPHLAFLPMHPQHYLMAAGGTLVFGFREVTFSSQVSFLYIGAFLMLAPILAESMAAATRTGVPLAKLSRCLAAAFVAAIVLGGIVYLTWTYTVGTTNLHPALANSYDPYRNNIYNFIKVDNRIDEYFRAQGGGPGLITSENAGEIAPFLGSVFVITGISFCITGLLTLARVIWLGFPLHPLGFALAFTPALYALWPSIAVGHLVKRLGLRFGGLQLSRRILRPFFVGLFVGDLLSLAVWRVVETLAPAAG